MLLVEDVDNREFLEKLFTAIYEELPEAKKTVNGHYTRTGKEIR